MDIFGIGVAELILILIIMLVVAGPKRMIEWAYLMGKYTRSLRKMWSEAMDVVQKELDDAGVDVKVPHELPNRQNVTRFAQQAMKPLTEQVEAAAKEFEADVKDVKKDLDEVKQIAKEADPNLKQVTGTGMYGTGPTKSKPAATNAPETKPEQPASAEPEQSPFGTWSQNAPANGNGAAAKTAGDQE